MSTTLQFSKTLIHYRLRYCQIEFLPVTCQHPPVIWDSRRNERCVKLSTRKHNSTGMPRFIALRRYCVFYKLKVCGNHASSKSIGAIFPTVCAHFVSLCHILIIIAIFQTCSLLLYQLLWSVISDHWCYYCNCFGLHELRPYKKANLIDKCCVCSDCSTDRPFPRPSPSPQATLFPETQHYLN
jgi:hypothetical protein